MLRLFLLWPFSILYGIAIYFRNKLYDWGLIKSESFDKPIISVGNLSAGGTGKTPLVEYLVRLLSPNYQVATLSRGYGGSKKSFHLVSENDDAFLVGDEPKQLKNKFPGVQVAIDPDRATGIAQLLSGTPTEVIILDDAFQHRKIRAGLSIITTSYSQPFYKDFLLPAGNLRETTSGKSRANIIVVTKCPEDISLNERQDIINKIKHEDRQNVFFTGLKYRNLLPFAAKEGLVVDERTEVLLLSGIANANQFEKYCRANYKVAEHIIFKDHHQYSNADLRSVRQKFDIIANPNKAIVTTEKDAARLKGNLPLDWAKRSTSLLPAD